MTLTLPCLLADPPPATGSLWLADVRLIDGTGAPPRERCSVLVTDGRIARIASVDEPAPADATVIAGHGRTLLPGLIDAHAHLSGNVGITVDHGAEPLWPGVVGHMVAAGVRAALRMGITTIRDVGAYGDDVIVVRQAIRYGAMRGPRLLVCGRIVSATAPGGRFFPGMYREADGADEIRKAVREQLRRGADFVKVMTTGARSVELEDPDPAQLTREEVRVLVEEAHRLGYRVAAHCEGVDGTAIAIEEGVDTIEHGMYLHRDPALLERLAADRRVLVPTLSCFYGVGPEGPAGCWAPHLVALAERNLEEADLTLRAAKAAGVRLAMGFDWSPPDNAALELVRMVHHGLTAHEAIVAATAGSAAAVGLDRLIGTVEPGKLADLLIVDGDPLAAPELLRDRNAIWLVLQSGHAVAGASLEAAVGGGTTSPRPGSGSTRWGLTAG